MSEQSTEQPTADQVYTAQVPGATDADLRTVVLAHPLTRKVDLDSLGLSDSGVPDSGVPAGGKIRVRAEHASSLIGAGYAAGVSPDKPEEVREVVVDDKFGKGADEDVADQPAEEQPPVAVVTDTAQAEAAGTPGVVEAPGVGADGSTDPAAPATATSGDGAAAAQAAQTTSKAAGRSRG